MCVVWDIPIVKRIQFYGLGHAPNEKNRIGGLRHAYSEVNWILWFGTSSQLRELDTAVWDTPIVKRI